MELSIIINNYETKGILRHCLKNFQLQHLPFEYEIIVIDNGSKNRIDQMMKTDFKEFKFIRSEINKGMGGGNNLGILQSSGKYILINPPDITILENSILTLYNFLAEHPKSGMVGPQILNPNGTRQISCFRFPKLLMPIYRRTWFGKTKIGQKHLQQFEMCDSGTDLSQPLPVDWVSGTCFMAKRSTLDDVGLFDDRFFLFMEDVDLCKRIKNADLEIWYLPQAHAISYPSQLSHKTWGTFKSYFSKYTFIHLISWLKYLHKWKLK